MSVPFSAVRLFRYLLCLEASGVRVEPNATKVYYGQFERWASLNSDITRHRAERYLRLMAENGYLRRESYTWQGRKRVRFVLTEKGFREYRWWTEKYEKQLKDIKCEPFMRTSDRRGTGAAGGPSEGRSL